LIGEHGSHERDGDAGHGRAAGDREPTRDARRGVVDPLAYFVGPSLVELDARRDALDVAEIEPFIDRTRSRVRSNTGDIELDWARGVLTVSTPRSRGVAGALAARSPFVLGEVTIEAKSPYGSVIVTALDDAPLAQSRQTARRCHRSTRTRTKSTMRRPVARRRMSRELDCPIGDETVRRCWICHNAHSRFWRVRRAQVPVRLGPKAGAVTCWPILGPTDS